MRRWNWRDARGLSLVEMLIVIAILALVTGAVFSIFTVSLQAYWKGDLGTQVQQGSRIALDRMSRDLRQGRRLYSSSTLYGTPGFTFGITGGLAGCAGFPQISFVLPHTGNVTLADGVTVITMTDAKPGAPNQGQIPYDGYYVSYYLSASQGQPGAWPPLNQFGPYLIRMVWDINASALSWTTIASNIGSLNNSTPLTFTDALTGGCPSTASRQVKVGITASLTTVNQTSTDTVRMDVTTRNLPSP